MIDTLLSLPALIASLANAATRWLDWQIATYPEKLANECDELEDEIERLERSTNPADHIRAERLQKRLLRKRGVIADALPAADTQPGGGRAGADN